MTFPYPRLKKLFRLLEVHGGQEQGWTTRALAERLEVTERTVRDDLKKLDHLLQAHGARLESRRQHGYSIVINDEQRYRELSMTSPVKDDAPPLPDTPEERIRYELFALLNAHQDIRMEDLADSLYISRATLNNDVKILRQIMEEYGIKLSIKPSYGVSIVGEEKSIRYCLAEYADVRDEEHTLSSSMDQEHLLHPVQISELRRMVVEQLRQHNVRMADLALKDLITHLAVMILRIQSGHGLQHFESVASASKMPPSGSGEYSDDNAVEAAPGRRQDQRQPALDHLDAPDTSDIIDVSDDRTVSNYPVDLDKLDTYDDLDDLDAPDAHDNLADLGDLNPLDPPDAHGHHDPDALLADSIIRGIEQAYQLECPVGERNYVQLHIASKRMTEDEERWQELQSDRLLLAVRSMLDYVHERYAYELRNDERLSRDLYAHLKPMMIRLEHGMNMRNPMLHHIRKHYPLAYEVTIGAVKQLQSYYPYDINDNEIGYLALHFGAALERKYHIPHRRRKTVLLVCGSGYGTARILESRLRSLFAELDVTRVVSLREYEDMLSVKEDMVISTIRLPGQKNKPAAVVAPIPTDRDMATITQLVRTSDQQQESSCFRYFRPEWFMRLPRATDKDTLLREMSARLLEQGVVTEGFMPAVLEREAMASTALGMGMAIPHPLELSSTRTAVYICLLEEPLPWDEDNHVHAVFLLSICKEDYEQAMGIYDLCVELIRQQPLLDRLQECDTFGAFLEVAGESLASKSPELY
ncbi:BglG family transcription antiterminator [Paenibacillus sp. FSL K6-1230]|uniref:BglG family transcription antiterminator n=1 Tax=Paenibacillus sp. FSL K6-1230 TaxID=2921603 RepID=UPI0030FA939E